MPNPEKSRSSLWGTMSYAAYVQVNWLVYTLVIFRLNSKSRFNPTDKKLAVMLEKPVWLGIAEPTG